MSRYLAGEYSGHRFSNWILCVLLRAFHIWGSSVMQTVNSSSGGSSTAIIELPASPHVRMDVQRATAIPEHPPTSPQPPLEASEPQLQKWNSPRINIWRCAGTFWSFVILGANDAAIGALIPYLEEWYNVNYTVISLVFLSPIIGYTLSALLNNHIHVVYGQRGVACIMSLSHLLGYGKLLTKDLHCERLTTDDQHSRCVSPSSFSRASGGLYPRWVWKRSGRQWLVSWVAMESEPDPDPFA